MKKRWKFDVEVRGTEHPYVTMPELMDRYTRCIAAGDSWEAYEALVYAEECGYLPGKWELARLLSRDSRLGNSQLRFAQAEQHYRQILNLLDMDQRVEAVISREFGKLLGQMQRPLGELAWLLHAFRLGESVPEAQLISCRKRLENQDINSMNKVDCYDLGVELIWMEKYTKAEVFLMEASRTNTEELVGRSYYAMGHLYRDWSRLFPEYEKESQKFFALANKYGHSDILKRNR